jgi:hypothetical protein
VLFGAAACVLAPGARASDVAAAAAIFDRGLAAMQSGDYEKACPALAESFQLDPLPGALFTLSECEARWGHVASSLTHYRDYLQMLEGMPAGQRAAQRAREKVARRQVAALAPQVPELTIELPPSAPPGTVALRDGKPLGAASLGAPLPVDPGTLVLTARVPGGGEAETRVTIARGEKRSVVLALPAGSGPGSGAGAQADESNAGALAPSGPSRVPMFLAFGVGAAGIGVGAVTGVLALGKKSEVDDHCVDHRCDHDGKVAADAGQALALVSTIGFAVGAVGVAAGVVLLATRPSDAPATRAFGPRSLDVAFDGERAVLVARGTFR